MSGMHGSRVHVHDVTTDTQVNVFITWRAKYEAFMALKRYHVFGRGAESESPGVVATGQESKSTSHLDSHSGSLITILLG